jgi:hypothetical protein
MTDEQIVDELIKIIDESKKDEAGAKAKLVDFLDGVVGAKTNAPISPERKLDFVQQLLNRFKRKDNTAIANDNSSYLKVGNDAYAYYALQVKK